MLLLNERKRSEGAIASEACWESFRREHFDFKVLNLNPGTLGCPSKPVKDSLTNWIEDSHFPLEQYQKARQALRSVRSLARSIWTLDRYNIAICGGTTSIFNQLVTSLAQALVSTRQRNKVVLITSSKEHSGAIKAFEKHPIFNVVFLSQREILNKDLFQIALEESRPDLALFSTRTYDTYCKLPTSRIHRQIKDFSSTCLTIFDLAQTIGIEDVQPCGDILVGSFHKWLFGPHGTGFMFLKKGLEGQLSPFTWGEKFDSENPASAFEPSGAQNFSMYPALESALKLYQAVGVDNVSKRATELSKFLFKKLECAQLHEFRLERKGPVILAHAVELNCYDVYSKLNQLGFYCKCIKNNAKGNLLRVGVPYYESRNRLLRFVSALKKVVSDVARSN